MGDLANMTDCDERVNGFRLLRWLERQSLACRELEDRARACNDLALASWHAGRADLLESMADDLESEIIPPDYPEDDNDTVDLDDPAFLGRPEQE